MNKDTFILKKLWKSIFDDLNDEQAGTLIKAIFQYMSGEKPSEFSDLEVKMAFKFISLDLDIFDVNYEKRCKTNRENGMKGADYGRFGGRPRKNKNPEKPPKNPTENNETPKTPKTPDKDMDNDKDNDFNTISNDLEILGISAIYNFDKKNEFCECETKSGEVCKRKSCYKIDEKNYCNLHLRDFIEKKKKNPDFEKFEHWIKENATYCSNSKHLKQLSEQEFLTLKEKFTSQQIIDAILDLENRKDLRGKYSNLYRTLNNWIKNRKYD